MITVYHNPRCSKSRQAIQRLEDEQIPFETFLYLKEDLTANDIKEVLEKLDYDDAMKLVRTNEKIWKDNYKDKELTNDQVIQAMVENPKLIERPIIINGNKAVVGRPTSEIDKIL